MREKKKKKKIYKALEYDARISVSQYNGQSIDYFVAHSLFQIKKMFKHFLLYLSCVTCVLWVCSTPVFSLSRTSLENKTRTPRRARTRTSKGTAWMTSASIGPFTGIVAILAINSCNKSEWSRRNVFSSTSCGSCRRCFYLFIFIFAQEMINRMHTLK